MRDTTDGNVESADAIERIRSDDGSGIITVRKEHDEDPREDERKTRTIASNECNGEYTDLNVKTIELGLSVLYNRPKSSKRVQCLYLCMAYTR